MTRVVVNLPGAASLTAGGFCAPCVAQELQAQTAAVQKTYQMEAEPVSTDVVWEGPLAYEDLATGDGRLIKGNALRWDESNFPLPLRWAPTDIGAHGGAVVVGLITEVWRDGSKIMGRGVLDTATEYGAKAHNLMLKGMLKGVSVDLDDMDVELQIKQEIVQAFEDADVIVLDDSDEDDDDERETTDDGYVVVGEYASDDERYVITSALLRAATLVDIPAFKDAELSLVAAGGELALVEVPEGIHLTAAAPVNPPARFFENPGLTEPTPITITEDGRIFGHIALWGTCHTGFKNACVTPPKSYTNYAWFRTGALLTDEGTEIPVGKITMSTGHAGTALSAAPAAAHYDDTGVVAADVASGEDKHGIWISGALRSTLTPEQVRELRAAPMSGDWRTVGGNLELVALLAVNLPGFPVPRTRALVASGRTSTLLSPVPELGGISADTKVEKSNNSIKLLLNRAQAARLAKEFRGGV